MKDTSQEVEERFFDMMLSRSGTERLRMGFDMFETAKRLVTAAIVDNAPGLSDADVRLAVFDRFYGEDLPEDARARCRGKMAVKPEERKY
ncbi:MAG: hypothetical protein HY884_03355 [Deltaproteobacteria bacterium]|nr:hypothetical protein [Deltaproteobacteria bacterium]